MIHDWILNGIPCFSGCHCQTGSHESANDALGLLVRDSWILGENSCLTVQQKEREGGKDDQTDLTQREGREEKQVLTSLSWKRNKVSLLIVILSHRPRTLLLLLSCSCSLGNDFCLMAPHAKRWKWRKTWMLLFKEIDSRQSFVLKQQQVIWQSVCLAVSEAVILPCCVIHPSSDWDSSRCTGSTILSET